MCVENTLIMEKSIYYLTLSDTKHRAGETVWGDGSITVLPKFLKCCLLLYATLQCFHFKIIALQ